jgi:ligand-binding sensor domain-containing protein
VKKPSLLLALICALASSTARAEPSTLPRLNIAALAASETDLFVGGFDQGLWIVSRAGQARHFEDAALSPHINALAWSESEQVLWLGTARGLTRCKPSGGCARLGPASAVHALLLRRDGSLVAGGDAGLTFVNGTRSETVGKKQRAPYRSVWALAEHADGTLFIGATNGLFWGEPEMLRDGKAPPHRASLVTGALPDDWVTALLVRAGRVHVGTYNSGLVSFRIEAGRLSTEAADASLGYVNPGGVVATLEGELAFATMDGLRSGMPGDTNLTETQGRDITAIFPAWQGGYWVGTRQGLEWIRLSAV